jgi:cell division protein FtsI (penicillin-binding protein 3)
MISGGGVAGVAFGEIAKHVMARDARRDISELVDSTAIFIPEVMRGNIADARYVLDKLDVRHAWNADKAYSKGKLVWGKVENTEKQVLLTEVDFAPAEGKVPNVKGLGAKDAVYMLEACGLRVQLSGMGKVYSQSLSPGSTAKKGQNVYLRLK